MSRTRGFRSLRPRQWTPRTIAWVGGLFIAVIAVMAVYDIVQGYRTTVRDVSRELDSQARVIAEQTVRSVQAVDVVLRHLAQEFERGPLAGLSDPALRGVLQEQAVGLVQIDGLVVVHADGSIRASSYVSPAQEAAVNLSATPVFRAMRQNREPGLFIGGATRSSVDGAWMFPMTRRLESPTGEFAGVMAGRGRIAYFQEFYRDVRLDQGTTVALIHRDGTLMARHPSADAVLGKRLALSETTQAALKAGLPGRVRTVSPVDGVDRFVALQPVPEYPLAVFVTRDAGVALAAWRAQTLGTAVRTLALGLLAALLLWLAARQLARLHETRASLEASQERFALAVAGSDDGIWDFDFVAGRAFNSARSLQLVGMPPGPEIRPLSEWLATIPRYLHPDDLPGRKAAMEAHLAGRTPTYEVDVRHRHADGSYRWVRIRGLCVRDASGKPVRMAGSVSDIDARKRAEEALRASEERYQLAVAGSNQGLWDWDLASDRLFLSPRAQRLNFVEPGEPLRPRKEWIALTDYHRDDLASVRSAISAHLHGETPELSIEYRVRHHSGDWHWYRQRGLALRDAGGRPYRMAGSMEDITEQKNAEAHRAQLEGQLLQAKKLEAIGTLAGGIAHDFNNILAAILGYGEMAQKSAAEGTALRRHVDAVVSAGLRAKSLVERILAFSRSGVGERLPVHVQSVVAEALDLVAASLPPHVRLLRRLDAGDAAVMGDPTQIHQVVMNLCANAAQAMKSTGTITVSLAVVDKSESIAATSALASGRYVRLRVRDTGAGIAPNVRERIFDPFFTTKDVGVGTGLGLSMVHGIVTDLGGGIDVDSQPGEGSAFTVFLPLSSAAAAVAAAEEEIPSGSGETILIVDDEEILVHLGEEMIATLGYEPVGYASSNAALAAFRAAPQRFDAVLSDEAMPELTGSELARAIRALRPGIPIVLMSGVVSPALAARAREAGVSEVLAKPLVSRDIARALANAVRRRQGEPT